MTSSNSFEISVAMAGSEIFRYRSDSLVPEAGAVPGPILDAEWSFALELQVPPRQASVRLKLEGDTLGSCEGGPAVIRTADNRWLRNELGQSRVVVEAVDEEGEYQTQLVLALGVLARPSVERDYRVMLEEIERVHLLLADDVIGRSSRHASFTRDRPMLLRPEVTLQQLQQVAERLGRAIAAIAKHPSTVLRHDVARGRLRPGDACGPLVIADLLRDPAANFGPGGGLLAGGAVRRRTVAVSRDLPEHRHIAHVLKRLAQRSRVVAKHATRSAELLQEEELRWGRRPGDRTSVYEQRDLPRVRGLEKCAREAQELARAFEEMRASHPFLCEAGPPRTPFGPTPTFTGRLAYRAAYLALLDAKRPLGSLVDGSDVRRFHRNLASLYEYWCYIRVVELLRERLGPPLAGAGISLVHEIYRPDMRPGQTLRFAWSEDMTVSATYEPSFPPAGRAPEARFVASLTPSPLRPDVVVAVERSDGTVSMLGLDAKSTDRFNFTLIREVSDYRGQIFEQATGRQPMRQFFLMHRDENQRPICNLPGYLEGRFSGIGASLIGAVPCIPESVGCELGKVALVVSRFLAACGVTT